MTKNYVKYLNRKIYSRELHRYVTVNQITDEVRNGFNVVVLCSSTKVDVTDAVLTQAVIMKGISRDTALTLLRA